MPIFVTPVYAGLITLLFVVLSFRVIGMRRSAHVGLGDGGNRILQRRLRAHGNFAEYVPLALLLMALAELQAAPLWALHLVGMVLIGGRLLHAFGVSREPETIKLRVIGMAMTFAVLLAAALMNLGLGGLGLLFVG